MDELRETSVCVLAVDDGEALALTLASVAGLGPIVVGVPEGCEPPAGGADVVVPLTLDDTVGGAWDRLLRAAPTEVCFLLHAGEVVVAGHPALDPVGSTCTIVDHPDPFALPDRLGAVRLVDGGTSGVTGRLRPLVAPPAMSDAHAATVVVDAGSRPGPIYTAWLQHVGAMCDSTDDAAELYELAAMLAGTGELDAATARLLQLLGAVDGDLGRRVARLLAFCAVRRSRRVEVELGAREWERLGGPPGPALALRAAALAAKLRSGAVIPLVEAAQRGTLVDDDGIGVDRTWVDTMLSDAKVRVPMLEPAVALEIQKLKTKPNMWQLCDGWLQLGRPLRDLAASLTGDARRRFVDGVLEIARGLDAVECLGLAEWLAEKGITPQVLNLVQTVAVRGELRLDDALAWSERLRADGKVAECPLPLMAVTALTPPVSRVRAAAALVDRFADPRGTAMMREAAAALHPAALAGTLLRLGRESPAAVVPFIEAAGRTRARRATLADTLEAGGAPALAGQLRAV